MKSLNEYIKLVEYDLTNTGRSYDPSETPGQYVSGLIPQGVKDFARQVNPFTATPVTSSDPALAAQKQRIAAAQTAEKEKADAALAAAEKRKATAPQPTTQSGQPAPAAPAPATPVATPAATPGATPWPTTKDQIVAFQRAHKLNPDGLIGNKTMGALLNAGATPPAGFKPVANRIHPAQAPAQAQAQGQFPAWYEPEDYARDTRIQQLLHPQPAPTAQAAATDLNKATSGMNAASRKLDMLNAPGQQPAMYESNELYRIVTLADINQK